MFRKSLGLILASLGIGVNNAIPSGVNHSSPVKPHKPGKGQLRAAKPKPSGAAQLKRQAKKRRNIRAKSKK